jgi:hypothetical protein
MSDVSTGPIPRRSTIRARLDRLRWISFSQEQLVSMSAVVAGAVIAFYQLGYGIAAFGAGPLQSAGVSLSTIFGFTAIVAVAMGLLSFVLARPHHRAPVHPRPATHLHAEAA